MIDLTSIFLNILENTWPFIIFAILFLFLKGWANKRLEERKWKREFDKKRQFKKEAIQEERKKEPSTSDHGGATIFPKRPLSKPEQILYHRLVEALPDHLILPQVSFSRFLFAKGGDKSQNFARFGKVRQKVVDYLICDKSFRIIAAVELQDSSHTEEKDAERRAIFKEAGLKLIEWDVGRMPSREDVQFKVLGNDPMTFKINRANS